MAHELFVDVIKINGKAYTKSELRKIGIKHRNKIRWIPRSIGIAGFVGCAVLLSFSAIMPPMFLSLALLNLIITLPAFIISFNIYRDADFVEWGITLLDPMYYQKLVDDIRKNIKLEQISKTVYLCRKKRDIFLLDAKRREFQIISNSRISDVLTIKDFKLFELLVDDQIVTSYKSEAKTDSGLGGAVVGGLLFGGAGAIAGAIASNGGDKQISGTEIKTTTHVYTLRIRTYNLMNPSYVFVLDSLQVAEEITSILEILASQNA